MNTLSSTFQRLIIIPLVFVFITCDSPNRSWSNPNDPKTDLDPSEWAPSNLQAQVLNDSEIKLTWEKEDTRISGFRLERSTGGNYTQIAEVEADITEFTDTGLNYGTDYTYRVKAFTDENESGYTNTAEMTLFYDCTGLFMGTAIEDCFGICEGNAVEDIDGTCYETVEIGDQVWMAENLMVTHYRNGDPIPTGHNNSEWAGLSTGAYCYYDNNSTNGDTYGALYNWYAVDDSRNIAPEGWHVPTDDEWKTLEMHLGMSQSEADNTGYRGTNEGSKLAGNADLWNDGDLENNAEFGTSGFTALPGGYRGGNGGYYFVGSYGYFWSSTESYSYLAWARTLDYYGSEVSRSYSSGRHGFSVRCLRD